MFYLKKILNANFDEIFGRNKIVGGRRYELVKSVKIHFRRVKIYFIDSYVNFTDPSADFIDSSVFFMKPSVKFIASSVFFMKSSVKFTNTCVSFTDYSAKILFGFFFKNGQNSHFCIVFLYFLTQAKNLLSNNDLGGFCISLNNMELLVIYAGIKMMKRIGEKAVNNVGEVQNLADVKK